MLSPDHQFVEPAKVIKSVDDVKRWEESEAYVQYLGFIQARHCNGELLLVKSHCCTTGHLAVGRMELFYLLLHK